MGALGDRKERDDKARGETGREGGKEERLKSGKFRECKRKG